jgi:hypothetical protein
MSIFSQIRLVAWNRAIAAVKSGIVDVLTQIQALGSDVWFGAGDYKDFPIPAIAGNHAYAFKHQPKRGLLR